MAYGLTDSLQLLSASSQAARISDASQTGLDFTGALTLEGWYKFATTPSSGTTMYLVNKYIGNSTYRSYGWRLANNSGTLQLMFRKTSNDANFEEPFVDWTPSTDTWYHLAVTYSGGTTDSLKFYVNGSQQGATQSFVNSGILNGAASFCVGALYRDDSGGAVQSPLNGDVSLVRAWSVARTEAQIAANICEVLGATANMQGEWTFDSVYTDGSGNGNTLTALGSPSFTADVPSTCNAAVVNSNFFAFM